MDCQIFTRFTPQCHLRRIYRNTIDATLDVFGEVVDVYTMTESVRDEITVRIVYEGRAAKVV